MKKLVVLLLIAAWAVLLPGAAAAAKEDVHVVDDDLRQCAKAAHTSIQAAVDAADPGDEIRVCPGLYVERVVVDQQLTIKGQPGAVESVDCFAAGTSRLDDLDPTVHAIVQGPPDTSPPQAEPGPLFLLDADHVELSGLVLQGAPAGMLQNLYTAAVRTSADHSGYRVHHNLIRLNTLGVELGGSGTHLTRVDHNCLRENTWHLANQRLELEHARVDHNSTAQSTWFAYEVGWYRTPMADVTFDRNTSKGERQPYYVENTDAVTLSHNTIERAGLGIQVWGANRGLRIIGNTITRNTGLGVQFVPPSALAPAVTSAFVQGNAITENLVGIGIFAGTTRETGTVNLEIAENVLSDNTLSGLQMQTSNTGNVVRGNVAERNGVWGIAARGATGNDFVGNRMLGNSTLDALDQNGVGANDWVGNQCATASPASLCDAP